MLQAFVFERVAVLVGPWHEPVDPPERAGAEAGDAVAVGRDADAVRDAIPAIVAAVNAAWDAVRTPAP